MEEDIQKIINRYPNCKNLYEKNFNNLAPNKNLNGDIAKCFNDINTTTNGFICPDDYNNIVKFTQGGFLKNLKYRSIVNPNFELVAGYGTPVIINNNATVKEKDNDYVKSEQQYLTENLIISMKLPEVLVDPATTLYIGGYTFYSELKGVNQIIAYASDGYEPIYEGSYNPGDVYMQKYDGTNVKYYINGNLLTTTPINNIKTESLYIGFDDPLKPKDETFTFNSIYCDGKVFNSNTTPPPPPEPPVEPDRDNIFKLVTNIQNLDENTLSKIENDDEYYNMILESVTLFRNILNQSSCILSKTYNGNIVKDKNLYLSDKLISRIENILNRLTNKPSSGIETKDIIIIILVIVMVILFLYFYSKLKSCNK